jgi:predicted Zn-dependent protease
MRAVIRSLTACSLAALVACAPSVQQEVAIGDEYHQQLQQELPMVKDAAAVASFREAVGPLRRVAERQNLNWTFDIVNSDQVNAFAVPGGHIYVFRGLIERAATYDEFAGAVAHEIAHVDLRHSAEQMGQASAANLGVNLAYIVLGRQPGTAEQAAVGVAGGAVFAKFSRDDENEADSVAVRSLTQAGIDPGGLPRMFEKLQQIAAREPSKVEQWFSSHPMPADRIENTRRIIQNDAQARQLLGRGRTTSEAFSSLKQRLRALPPAPKEMPSN